jgi:hypothetical protein
MRNMPHAGWSPRIGPDSASETAYLVVDRLSTGAVYRETDINAADLETVVADLLSGQFKDPVRIVAFNASGQWSDDVSADIAAEIQARCDMDGLPIPIHVADFVEAHQPRTRQLTLRLV